MRYGILAEYKDSHDFLEAVESVRKNGFKKWDAFAPFPLEGLSEAMGLKASKIPVVVFFGGLLGALIGYGMQWFYNTQSYPMHIGGRPYHAWPAFIPITFEVTILCAALGAFLGLLVFTRLPRLHHPLFNVRQFKLAHHDRFFICIEEHDKHFDEKKIREMFKTLKAQGIYEVPND